MIPEDWTKLYTIYRRLVSLPGPPYYEYLSRCSLCILILEDRSWINLNSKLLAHLEFHQSGD